LVCYFGNIANGCPKLIKQRINALNTLVKPVDQILKVVHQFLICQEAADRTFPAGTGKTKKIASQQAARKALKILQDEYGKLPDSMV